MRHSAASFSSAGISSFEGVAPDGRVRVKVVMVRFGSWLKVITESDEAGLQQASEDEEAEDNISLPFPGA